MSPLDAAQRLSKAVDGLSFQEPVAWTYNPLAYAWDGHRQYCELLGQQPLPRRVLMVGMNPGPWGMGQTGVPFGDVDMVRAMGIETATIEQPADVRDDRPIYGFECPRNEVSGSRLYGGLQDLFGTLPDAYEHLYIANYAPLLFFDEDGGNLTPPRLRKADREALFEVCDEHLVALIEHFEPETVVGIGRFAERRAKACMKQTDHAAEVTYLLHPSPASPMANKDGGAYWQAQLRETMEDAGLADAFDA